MKIDYTDSLSNLILQCQFGQDGNNFNKLVTFGRFPFRGEGIKEFEYEMMQFSCKTSTLSIFEDIKKKDVSRPWVAAGIEHGLWVAKVHPEKQANLAIVTLGSIGKIANVDHVPVFGVNTYGHNLTVCRSDLGWLPGCEQFLIVRPILPQIH